MKNEFFICNALTNVFVKTLSEQKRISADSLKWGYSGMTITSIPVVDENGNMFRLTITPKTKIEVKTVYGESYRFYIQSINITGNDGFLGTDQMWSGFELRNHTQKIIMVREITQMTILSDEKAVAPIARP